MCIDLQINRAAAEDAESIAEILVEAFSEFREEYTSEAFEAVTPSTDEILRRLGEGPIWVAAKNGEIVGTVSAVREPEWLYIRSMAVRPKAQGLGVGFSLLNVVEEYAIENGFDRLFLYTTYFSPRAIKVYERRGFMRGRDTTADEWFGTPGLAMEKKLDRNAEKNVVGS